MSNVAVLGAGAWGTALAIHIAKVGRHQVTLWSHSGEHAQQLKLTGENKRYLPNHRLPASLAITSNLAEALQNADSILVVVPSHVFRETLQQISNEKNDKDFHLAWATKGLEPTSKKLLHQVAEEQLPNHNRFSVLSGPTFAEEVVKGLPTAIVSASKIEAEANHWAEILHNYNFRVYTQADMAGVEIGGAYKNIIAIATGVSDGIGMGANAKAAIISRGMAEINRLGIRMGAEPATLMGLAGLGDLVLTCNDDLSRNRRFGLSLAKGNTLAQVQTEIGQVVEGVKAAKIINELADSLNLDLPIAKQVYQLVSGEITTKQALENLLSRTSKSES